MYINEIKIDNYGAIRKLLIKPEFNSNGSPKPLVIVGKNGTGKTLLLSHLVDSMIEMKRKKYLNIKEVINQNYYKIGKKSYISHGASYSYVYINYQSDLKEFYYSDFMTKDLNITRQQHPNAYFKNVDFSNQELMKNGFFKNNNGESIERELDENILLYFPVHRYYSPSWYNRENKELRFQFRENYVGRSNKSLIKENVLEEIEQWILDILLDKYIYEEVRRQVTIIDNGNFRIGTEVISTQGKNTILQNLLNELLTTIYKVKYPNIQYARLGVSPKNERRVSIYLRETNSEEKEIAPTFSHLSSGEAMLIALFGSLLKEYDELNTNVVSELSNVKGTVLIDEIDLNLHIEYTKEILPKLVSMFPNVQFIFTTHSPFLLLGMEESFGEKWQLINMPEGKGIAVNDFNEIQEAYTIFTEGHKQLAESYKNVEDKVNNVTRTLIITEGKTDWKHLDNAYATLMGNGTITNLDIEFYKYENEVKMSDSELYTLLKEFSKVPNIRKIVGIFDNDEANGKNLSRTKFKDFGNNVYGFSIPTPTFRSGHQGISIEFLYNDDDLKREDRFGRRIYLTSEFNEKTGRHTEDLDINMTNVNKIKGKTEQNNSKIIDTDVFNKEGESLALSKNDFANNVYHKHVNFQDMDLTGFEEVFNIIKQIQYSEEFGQTELNQS